MAKLHRLALYRRDAGRIRRLAARIEQQVSVLYRNIETGGEAEALRFLYIENLAVDLRKAARRAAKRYWKSRGEGPYRPRVGSGGIQP